MLVLQRARDVAISIARSKIESLKSGISDLKMKRAMAEITEMASGMVAQLGGSGDTLNRLESIVEEERYLEQVVAVVKVFGSASPERERPQPHRGPGCSDARERRH